MVLLSLVVPVLNEETHILQFLHSVHDQLSKCELIFIDGGSTDRTVDIILDFANTYNLPIIVHIDTTRNIGFIRNIGARLAHGSVLFHTNSDAVMSNRLVLHIMLEYANDTSVVCVTGRTVPLESTVFSHFAYGAFDLLRWMFTKLPYPIKRISPSGNFMAIRSDVFWELGGFPCVRVNEDGQLGERLTEYCAKHGTKAKFVLRLWTGHFAKRFNEGPLKTLLFYSYVFGNFSKRFKHIMAPLESRSGAQFANR